MAIEGGNIVWIVRASTAKLKQGLEQADTMTAKFSKSILKHSRAIGIGMTAAGAAIVGVLGSSAKKSVEFQDALAALRTLGVKDADKLGESIRKIAREYGLELIPSVWAAYDAISHGADEFNAPLILEASAKAAVAGMTDLKTAIQLGMGTADAFGKSYDELGTIFDTAFVSVNQGVTQFSDLANNIGKTASTFAGAKISANEMYAAVAALTKAGVPVSEAFTKVNAIINELNKVNPKVTESMRAVGVEFSSAGASANGLVGLMNQLKAAGFDTNEKLKDLFSSSEALGASLALTGNQNEILNNLMEESTTNTGQLQAAFDAFVENNPAFTFRQLRAEINDLQIEIGNALLPVIRDLLKWLLPIVQKFAEWVRMNPEAVKGWVELAAKVGAFLLAAGPIVTMLPGIIALFKGIGVAIAALSGPVGWVVLAIAVAVAAIIANWEEISWAIQAFRDKWNEVMHGLPDPILWAIDMITAPMEWLIERLTMLIATLFRAGQALFKFRQWSDVIIPGDQRQTAYDNFNLTPQPSYRRNQAAGGNQGAGLTTNNNTTNAPNITVNIQSMNANDQAQVESVSQTLAESITNGLQAVGVTL